ncbi:hypothetical protein DYBT9623_02757 [Dyadobacter sp. CECT 9623]|uniref:DUF7684 domain-containing protein n=1 Tax=Dyadobacter linearis TaxID=2823330 RepID=A0ABM8URJ2_9BACT|nr:hypothetical protein [Dyadobacter sp. CECT 9623]CAG5070017.1 hypothetical protein DYBT9623_02757 [Dyadobacter sp. CECT 9623]
MPDLHLNNRRIDIIEYNTYTNWASQLPNSNWLCILVSDDRERRYLDEVINKIIARDVCWVAAIGNQCELLHDLVDEEVAFRGVDIDSLYLPKHDIMTTFHRDFQEGIWFSIYAAHDEEFEIETITILDLTSGKRKKEIELALEN